MPHPIQKEIVRVLRHQHESIRELTNHINRSFVQAVDLLYKCRGKVVVTGVGKSGLIAEKISATFSSTGTPAVFLHPTEGMHGSLGIVQKNDVVLALGKSGESAELLSLIPSIQKIGAKLISITSKKSSTLAKKSSIVLHIPIEGEACPLNLAPTTSSTLSLVIGDALAIALMKKRDFKPENFALFHPGGLLGKKLLLKVGDVMRTGRANPIVPVTSSFQKLLLEITKKMTGAASIVDKKGKLVGLVTDFDIRKVLMRRRPALGINIKDIMNPHPTSTYPTTLAVHAIEIMENRKKPYTVLPVVDKRKRVVGMVHLHDLLARGLSNNK